MSASTEASLPALLDEAMRQLADAKGIEAVLEMRDKAEALKVYAKKRKAAVGAQNDCARFIALCERRIGQELRKARERRELAQRSDSLRRGPVLDRPEDGKRPTLRDIGLTYDQASTVQKLADLPESVINEAADQATAEGRAVLKREMAGRPRTPSRREKEKLVGAAEVKRMAAEHAAERAKVVKPAPAKKPDRLERLVMWLYSGSMLVSECRDGETAASDAAHWKVPLREDHIEKAHEFLSALQGARNASKAAAAPMGRHEAEQLARVEEKIRRAQQRDHLRLVHSREQDAAEQLCHLLARLRDVAEGIDPELLHEKFPDKLRHNLHRTLRPAAIFLAKFHAAYEQAEADGSEVRAGARP